MLTGTWYTEQVVPQAGVASSEALAAKAEALSALVDEVSLQRMGKDQPADAGKGRLHVVLLSSASAGAPGRLVLLRAHGGTNGVPPHVQIALAVPLSAAPEKVVQQRVQQHVMEMSRAISRLTSTWGCKKKPIDWAAQLPGDHQLQVETCMLAFGTTTLELRVVSRLGVDKQGALRLLHRSSNAWPSRLVVLRRNFLLLYPLVEDGSTSDALPSAVLRIDPDSDVIEGFDDSSGAAPHAASDSTCRFALVAPTGEQAVLSAPDEHAKLVWVDAIQFASSVISAPWGETHQFSRNLLEGPPAKSETAVAVEPVRGHAASPAVDSGANGNRAVESRADSTSIAKANGSSASAALTVTDSSKLGQAAEDLDLASQGQELLPRALPSDTHTDIHTDTLQLPVPTENAPAAPAGAIRSNDADALNPSVIEDLREMVASKLRSICTDMMKGASSKPSGPDPSAAALVLGQNFLGRAQEEVAKLRRMVSAECNMEIDWINYVLGAGYPELEEFLGWVQASYLDNLEDPGLRRVARVANLRTDAFLAGLRGHEKPKPPSVSTVQPAVSVSISVTSPAEAETVAGHLGETITTAERTSATLVDASPPKVDNSAVLAMIKKGAIGDAVEACGDVRTGGMSNTTGQPCTAEYNFLLELCVEESLGESVASSIFSHLEQSEVLGLKPDATTYSHFIKILCHARNAARAITVLTQMQTRSHIPCDDDFMVVLDICVGLADVPKGIQVVTQAIEAGSTLSLVLLNALLGSSDTTEDATVLFQAITSAGYEPDKRSYQQLIEAACLCGDSSLTVRALRQMAKRDISPTEALLTRAVERTATINVHHTLKILELCAAGSLPLPAQDSVLFFLESCCREYSGGSSGSGRSGASSSKKLSVSAIQDCLTAMHSHGFKIEPDVKDTFRTLRVSVPFLPSQPWPECSSNNSGAVDLTTIPYCSWMFNVRSGSWRMQRRRRHKSLRRPSKANRNRQRWRAVGQHWKSMSCDPQSDRLRCDARCNAAVATVQSTRPTVI